MPSLKETRNRVKSVKNTQKITRAMKLVAAAKLRRAQDAVQSSRPFASKMREVLGELCLEVDSAASPLFAANPNPQKVLLVPFSSDRGLCGGFNATLFRRTEQLYKELVDGFEEIAIVPVGSKGRSYFGNRNYPAPMTTDELNLGPDAESAEKLAKQLVSLFLDGGYDEIVLVYNEFISALTQEVVVEKLLPLSPSSFGLDEDAEVPLLDRVYEPGQKAVLESLLPQYIQSQVLRALLESQASEQGARMTAMDNATSNANDLINTLTLQLNRARQAAITTELTEITSGAEALKG